LLDSILAVRATTAAVRASILASSDINLLQRITVYRGVDGDAIFYERVDEFTQDIRRCAKP
jgi:hypothetical protein